jgi:hypothetical protein
MLFCVRPYSCACVLPQSTVLTHILVIALYILHPELFYILSDS